MAEKESELCGRKYADGIGVFRKPESTETTRPRGIRVGIVDSRSFLQNGRFSWRAAYPFPVAAVTFLSFQSGGGIPAHILV